MSDSCDYMDCRLPGSSAHGILQARILEWVAISFSRVSSDPGIEPGLLHCRQILYQLSHEESPVKALLLCYFRWKLRHSPLFHILSNSQAPHAAFPSSTPFMCPHTRMGRALHQGVLCYINSTAALLR